MFLTLRVTEERKRISSVTTYRAPHIDIDRATVKGTIATVGLMVPDIENPFFAVMVKSVLNEFRRTGVSLVVADTNEEPLGEGEIISTMLQKHGDRGNEFTLWLAAAGQFPA